MLVRWAVISRRWATLRGGNQPKTLARWKVTSGWPTARLETSVPSLGSLLMKRSLAADFTDPHPPIKRPATAIRVMLRLLVLTGSPVFLSQRLQVLFASIQCPHAVEPAVPLVCLNFFCFSIDPTDSTDSTDSNQLALLAHPLWIGIYSRTSEFSGHTYRPSEILGGLLNGPMAVGRAGPDLPP